MSTDKSAQSIKDLTERSTESDKTQLSASNDSSSAAITTAGSEYGDIKKDNSKMKLDNLTSESTPTTGSTRMTIPESASDFNQWLQSMLAVARLPGGLPIEFRRKLWLALAERYLKRRGVDWEVEKVKWLSEKSRADDEELGIQIVKDLHRTGHSMLSGASGQLYQAKLKKILMGYTRWNPTVGYCQGFNMLGAIILQVMDKCEVDSIKVMIFLIEGLLPNGYFCGALMGLQADMAVFRELLGYKLPKLARHLQKLQGSTSEPSFEPPIINVFTMQWFLTLFCNCLPMSYVLRIWDLIMIEGSDILLRTALSIWKLLEDRILREVKTADDFYCKMETLSGELLNGSLIDANRLIHMISTLGPISELQHMRQKHLTASYNDQKQLKMLYSNAESDESRIAVANAWASRRGSQPTVARGQSDREKIALDITILKKQYDKLRERQKQAHIILTSAVTKQQQQKSSAGPSHVNKLLVGKNAIISKGRKGPPKGSIPPVRNQKLVKSSKLPPKQNKQDETLHWKNTDEAKKRRNSMTWKELNAERRPEVVKTMSKSSSASSLGSSNNKLELASPKRRSDSSSYSEDSDGDSSPSTSLCDDDITSSLEASPMKKKRHKDLPLDVAKKSLNMKTIVELSPTAVDIKDCPEISVSCTDVDNKTTSPIANFYLDLNSTLEGGDITSISQLSPMPDISSYFTAISPITTPCNFFEFPDFSSFILSADDDKYQVNDEGVTNEFFERVFEENLALAITPDDVIMSKSFSPSIQQQDKSPDERKELPKYMKQKSLSMDEQSRDKEEIIAINRSYSDGTIINVDGPDGFQRIIAENSKILNKLIPRTAESPDDTQLAKAIFIDEPKTPNNLSDVEEEIAAIDQIDEAEEAKEGIMLSDIQELADYRIQTATSSTCNTYTKDENVTERSEKSISDASEVLATLVCSPLKNKSVVEEFEALTVRDFQPKVEARHVEEKIESPKFNEIQLMVTKLKEEMESQLKSSEAEVEEKIVQPQTDKKVSDVKVESDVTIVISCAENDEKLSEIPIEETSAKLPEEAPEVASEVKPPEAADKSPIKDGLEREIDANHPKLCDTNVDLEKTASESLQKIDKSSDKILENLNTQLEMCQKNQTARESLNSDHETNIAANRKLEIARADSREQIETANLESKYENEANTSKDVRNEAKSFANETTAETVKNDTKKDSNVILEKLNMQLQRCEENGSRITDRKSDEPSTSYSSISKPTYETSAVMELAVLIKERELEKLSEQKLAMKNSKDVDFDLSLSPLRTTSRSKSNISSPESTKSGKFNNFFCDHEPRSEVRRRDINTLETEQRCRRQFKSSPTNSLSSSPSNISTTLSSIQNTIKILDSACQKTDTVNYKNLDRAMESIEKICDTDKDWRSYKKNKYDASPSFKIDDVSFESYSSKRQATLIDDDKSFERSFDASPRRKRYDFEDEDLGFKREPSPSRFIAKTPEIDPDYVAKLRYLSTEDYIAGRKSPLGGSRERLDTKCKIDRSPTSPVLSTHFSRSPRSPSHSTSLLRFPQSDNRSSKSAENSPSRYSAERVESSYKYNSPSGVIDSRAESMSNLSQKPTRKYEFEWEKASSSKKYDFY